jgi:hypothetical protein
LIGVLARTQTEWKPYIPIVLAERKRSMNKEYWQRKADLCQKIGIEQLIAGDIPNGTRNLKRMVRALEEINLINANEGEDKSAADMWASLIASGAMLAGEGEGESK